MMCLCRSLIRIGKSKEIMYVKDGLKHAIPNWDTFVAMRLDSSKVVSLNVQEFEDVALGDPLPPL